MTMSKHRGRIRMASPEVGAEEQEAVASVLDSGQLASGDEVTQFESEFASFCGSEHGVATSNGTTALHTALEALGIGEGDAVVTTPFTFVATANAIRFAGAEPVFADIDPETFNLDPQSVASTIREREGEVAAILSVHLYGLPAELDVLGDIADTYGVPLIEDAAQAHGAAYRGRRVGSVGDVGCFSFYPTKNMTTGEGGMVVTDRDDIATRAQRFIDHGRTDSYEHADLGHNFRLTDIAAAIGREQLDRLPELVATRQANARTLRDGLADTPIETPPDPDYLTHAYNQFTVRTTERDALRGMLDNFGIDSTVYYPKPVHEQPVYDGVTVSAPESEQAATEVLSLPVHPQLSDADLQTILTAIEYFDTYPT